MRTSLKTILATAAIATLALTGCQQDNDPEPSVPSLSETPSTSPSPSAATPDIPTYDQAADEQTAIGDASATYLAYWRLADEIFAAQGAGSEQLEGWATPAARALAEEQITIAQTNGLVTEGYQTITVLDGAYASAVSGGGAEQPFGHVVLQACHNGGDRVVTLADGSPAPGGNTDLTVNAELIRDPATGAWTLTVNQMAETGC